MSGSLYYSKYLNYTCYPGTVFADGNATNLLRCVYQVVNKSSTLFYWKSTSGRVSNCSIQMCAPFTDLLLPNTTFDYFHYVSAHDYGYPVSCIGNGNSPYPEYGYSPLSAYCVNTSVYYACPNGIKRSSTCLWNSTSKTTYWNTTNSCYGIISFNYLAVWYIMLAVIK